MSGDTAVNAINQLRDAVEGGGARFRKLLYAVLVLVLAVILLLVLTLSVVSNVADVLSGSRKARATLLDVTAKLEECTTPGPNPPPKTGHDCYDRGVERTATAVFAIIDTNQDGIPDVKQLAESVGHPLPPPTTTTLPKS